MVRWQIMNDNNVDDGDGESDESLMKNGMMTINLI